MRRFLYLLGGVSVLLASAYAVATLWGASAASSSAARTELGDRQRCSRYSGLPAGWGSDAHAGMQHVQGAVFQLGSLRGYAQERPQVETRVASFWIDTTEVSNAQFASFVAATGYVTEAERGGGAAIFSVDAEVRNWWRLSSDANWRAPDGRAIDLAARGNEPVVDVTYADALAYAHWLHRELPTEAQWEFAAKAGRSDEDADRSLRDAKGRPTANFWQGLFPLDDSAQDGFAGRSPVGCYAANPWGLHDMVGNVWEWTSSIYQSAHSPGDGNEPEESAAVLPKRGVAAAAAIPRVIKGGSFLCADDYCMRARAASRQAGEQDLPAAHIGFRTVIVEDR